MIMQDDRNGSIKPIYQQIREDLLLGFQKTGEARLPSEREICKKYGVCRPTVHKALSYLVETGLVVRRPGKGSFFLPPEAGSGRNVAGVKLVIRKDWKIWSGDCYFGQTIQGIYETLNGCGLNLSIEQFNDRLLLQLLEDEVTSSIWLSPEKAEQEAIRMLADAGRTVTAINRQIHAPGVRFVSGDHQADGEEAGRFALLHRANRVIFFVSEAESGLFAAREAGIAHILGDAIPFRRVTLSLTGRTEAIRRAAKEFGADGNTAVVLNSGSLLEPALRVFPPRENLLLFADNAEPLRYGISLIVQPVAEIGRIAGKIAGAGETALSGTLVWGKLLTAEGVRA